MSGAPDWQDGEYCFRCRTQFTLVARKHHCRNCGNIFCAKCSSKQIPLPKLSIDKNVRVCDGCFEKISSKNEDPLTLATSKNDTSDQETKVKSSSSKSSGSASKSTNSKPPANASAPSEQELKEEEELQLALALSLSEAPAKVSFPDCRQFEEPVQPPPQLHSTVSNNIRDESSINNTSSSLNSSLQQFIPTSTTQPLSTNESIQYSSPEKQRPQSGTVATATPSHTQPAPEYQMLSKDQELFLFVTDVQSTAEIFTNRVNSCKLRNRPIANDSTIQSLFMKLTGMHTKVLEYIKTYEEERAGFESIQDKLSQIADARAALDALREEHQEKIREQAAEAERQRQSQLAMKLEAMRQKKTQMMQYQREIALQRIQEQEMMMNQQPQGQYQPPVGTSQQTTMGPHDIQQQQQAHIHNPVNQQQHQNSVTFQPTQIPMQPPYQQPAPLTQPQHQPPPTQPQHQLPQQVPIQYQLPSAQLQQQQYQPPQQLSNTKLDDEAPLISFDD